LVSLTPLDLTLTGIGPGSGIGMKGAPNFLQKVSSERRKPRRPPTPIGQARRAHSTNARLYLGYSALIPLKVGMLLVVVVAILNNI
jgi:hypothetical protein